MALTPEKAAIRFGEGLSPDRPLPGSIEAVLGQLTEPDLSAEAHEIPPFDALLPALGKVEAARKAYRKARGSDREQRLNDAFKTLRRDQLRARMRDHQQFLARSLTTEAPFRERLTRFWGDHFTVAPRVPLLAFTTPNYLEGAVRPHVAGRFADMLKAVVTHPSMLIYLDQVSSFGPNSKAARGRRGLNENLARELIELHTLGVGGAYSQADVRQLAELLTGLTVGLPDGFAFRPARAEPGGEQVLGRLYGGGAASLEDIFAVLEDLAAHPDTGTHLARKLAVHFCSDVPNEGMVAAMARAYRDGDGQLVPVYAAMLEHPFAWDSFGQKVKQPIDFITSALRAIALPPRSLAKLNRREVQSYLTGPLAAMGQPLFKPLGPDGWPETAEAWITPQGLAARLQWAMAVPSAFFRSLPDPRGFVDTSLGNLADERVRFAAQAAETRREGVGLVLASPGFQRR
ncbi:MAG: DUF1800 domain-containing protein [Pseudomonadota bacterium]